MEPTERNRRAWDAGHRQSEEASGIPPEIRELLPDVAGKHVLHLQCGSGEATADLAKLGALVTAVDISEELIDLARERAPDVAYVHADVNELPLELRRSRFDVVYGADVLLGVRELDALATGLASALRPGGLLVVHDEHPVAACVDALGHWRHDYFPAEESRWRLGDIVTAIAVAGFRITRLEEFRTLHPWLQRDRRVPWELAILAERG